MDKLRFESTDLTAANVDKIAELFPGVVTEGKVNFDLLRSMLGGEVYGDESYEFTWVGKRAAVAEAGRPIRKTLRPCIEESKKWDTTENLYIEGDNLDVLKVLQESYLGKVKMIYIDPPYNTGNDFVYRDNFTRDKDEYDGEAGVFDEDGDRLFRNTESNGRFHSDWCSMMYPRLVLARNLLRDDGVIFISIDDNEVAQLRKMCYEVFGENNLLGMFVWQSKKGGGSDNSAIVFDQEYVLAYTKSQDRSLCLNKIVVESEPLDKEDEQGKYRLGRELNKWGSNSRREDRPTMFFSIPGPNGEDVYPIRNDGSEGRWRWGKAAMIDIVAQKNVEFLRREDGTYIVYEKIRTTENRLKPYRTFITDSGTTADGSKLVKEIFNNLKVFDYAKPIDLVRRFVEMGTKPDAIILDFFSGSATTAHAVMQLNAEDGGKRKFIMVQLPEPCPEDSEAAKAGYNNICEIGKERIRRAGEKVVSDKWLVVSEEEKRKYGCKELSRADCLAKGNGTGQIDLLACQEASEGGTVLSIGSNAASRSVDSIEHSGGTSTAFNKGISAISSDWKGIESGTRDTIASMRESWIPCRHGYFGNDEFVTGNRENAGCPYKSTDHCPLTTNHSPDTGFRVLKLDSTNMRDVFYAAGEYTQDLLALMEDNIKDDRTDMDLLYACLLDWGLPLSMPHIKEKIDGFTVHTYNDGDLIACFDQHISDAVVREIAKRRPLRAVFRDRSFSSSPEKINVEEIFKLLAPNTSVKVL